MVFTTPLTKRGDLEIPTKSALLFFVRGKKRKNVSYFFLLGEKTVFTTPLTRNTLSTNIPLTSLTSGFRIRTVRCVGMWPTDDAISLHSGGGCARELLVPAFGLAVVMPLVAVVRMLETTLDAVCTLTAVMATHSHNPFQTLQELFTVATYCVMRGTCSNRGHSPTCIHAPVNMVTHYVPASRWGNPSLPSITTVPWPCHAALLLPSQPCTPRQQRYVLECLHSVHGIASVRVENHTVNKLRSSWSGSLPGSGEQQHHHVAR